MWTEEYWQCMADSHRKRAAEENARLEDDRRPENVAYWLSLALSAEKTAALRRVFVFRLAEGGAPYVTAVPDLRIPKRMLRSGEATECSEITF